MGNLFSRKRKIENEVNEELQFQSVIPARDYQGLGLSCHASRAMAEDGFGDVARIKKECIQISSGRKILIWSLNTLFIISLLVGLFLRMAIPESNLDRVGDCLLMIGGLGIVLVYIKQAGAFVLEAAAEPFRLGLTKNSPPVAFDEQGRSPFDRVRKGE